MVYKYKILFVTCCPLYVCMYVLVFRRPLRILSHLNGSLQENAVNFVSN